MLPLYAPFHSAAPAETRSGYYSQEVLDVQQSLYEKKLTSYPRSDCDVLPENQLDDRDIILSNLANRYTSTTLLAAMKGIEKYVKDLANILKDCSGLGTEATRAGVLETIARRGFVAADKKHIAPTELATTLFNILPEA